MPKPHVGHFNWPRENRELSPVTGWTREHWAAIADQLLLSVRPYFNDARSLVALPGIVSGSGKASDALEGFARTFLLFAFRLAGERGRDPLGFVDWYRDGLICGTDPRNPDRWVRPDEQAQAEVEAASIALGLLLTREWLWDTLDEAAKERVVDWLALTPGGRYPDNNWLWFRVTVETFLASVGGPFNEDRVSGDLHRIERFYHRDGWYADGSTRAFDYYCGWAMQLYPLLWAQSKGSVGLGSEQLLPLFQDRLSAFLDDYVNFFGADGGHILQGRSLIYRLATAAPLWMGALTGATTQPLGRLRRAASGSLKYFVGQGAIDERGLLSVGLYGAWLSMAQTYSGAGSPYWAAKGFLGLALPADHEVWTAVEEPLPVEQEDVRRVLLAPGWIVSGTHSDGIVRLVNHGTDRSVPGDTAADSPLYTRYAYSNVTLPPLTGDTLDDPVDNSIGVIDGACRTTHRTGFERGEMGDDGTASYASSFASSHWVDTSQSGPVYDVGSGREGVVVNGPRIKSLSIVRGSWEVRAARILNADHTATPLRLSGWPLAGAEAASAHEDAGSLVLSLCGLTSELHILAPAHNEKGSQLKFDAHRECGSSPLGDVVSVPQVVVSGFGDNEIVIAAVRLGRGEEPKPSVQVHPLPEQGAFGIEVRWGDNAQSKVSL